MSRIENSTKNILSNFASQILIAVLGFFSRTVFIRTLGEQYLGINGLFSNFISMLSLSELGVGTAITYKLYKPLAEHNEADTIKYMNFFKICYRAMGLVMMGIGLVCMPFIPDMINGDTGFFNVYFVFFLYLVQSVSTYIFFAYKSAILKADQKTYVVTNITTVVMIFQYIVQIILLVCLRNFYFYIAIIILGNLITNFIVSLEVDKRYAFLKKDKKTLPNKNEIKDLFKDCYALSIYKVNNVVLKTIDNIVLSKFIGLSVVGLYSNYTLIFNYLKNFMTTFYTGTIASLGNLHVSDNKEKEYKVCHTINYVTYLVYGVVAVGINSVINAVIQMWLGSEYLLERSFVHVLAAEFYIGGIARALSTFRTSMGLFQQGKYRPLIGAVINIVLSVLFVHKLGITGVILATVIANVSTYYTIDSYIIYKYGFHRSVVEYYKESILSTAGIVVAAVIIELIIIRISVPILTFLIGGILSVILPSMVLLLLNCKNSDFKEAIKLLIGYSKRVTGRVLKK